MMNGRSPYFGRPAIFLREIVRLRYSSSFFPGTAIPGFRTRWVVIARLLNYDSRQAAPTFTPLRSAHTVPTCRTRFNINTNVVGLINTTEDWYVHTLHFSNQTFILGLTLLRKRFWESHQKTAFSNHPE